MEKNNLDKLYQEKFNDFSELPDEQVWKRIEASLDKKRKKRVVPIWWYAGGAAAILLLGLWLINPTGGNDLQNQNAVTEAQNDIQRQEDLNHNAEETKKDSSQDQVQKEQNPFLQNESTNGELAKKDIQKEKSNAFPKQTNNTDLAALDKGQNPKNNREKTEFPINTGSEDQGGSLVQNNKEATEANTTDFNVVEKANQKIEEEAIVENEKKSIFEAIEEQKEDEVKVAQNLDAKKWSVGPSVAPVYFNAFGEGSPIHSSFAQNSKSGNISLSYGLNVAYEVTDKLTIRSGVHRVDYGYDTEEISFTSGLGNANVNLIDNINYTQASRTIVVENRPKSVTFNDAGESPELLGQEVGFNGNMVQQMGYVEVPLELSYALINKKFGVNIIGGVSSLFLIDNSVELESEGLVTEIGEANNVNGTNFSTNVGLGLNYNFSKNVQLNVEPMFKYQLSTFSDTAGSFNPYSLGIYSGLNFKF